MHLIEKRRSLLGNGQQHPPSKRIKSDSGSGSQNSVSTSQTSADDLRHNYSPMLVSATPGGIADGLDALVEVDFGVVDSEEMWCRFKKPLPGTFWRGSIICYWGWVGQNRPVSKLTHKLRSEFELGSLEVT